MSKWHNHLRNRALNAGHAKDRPVCRVQSSTTVNFYGWFGQSATRCCVLTYPGGTPEGQQLGSCQSNILAHAVLLAAFVRKEGPGGPGAPLGPLLLQPVGGPAVLQLVVVLLGLSRCCGSLSLSLHRMVTHK